MNGFLFLFFFVEFRNALSASHILPIAPFTFLFCLKTIISSAVFTHCDDIL